MLTCAASYIGKVSHSVTLKTWHLSVIKHRVTVHSKIQKTWLWLILVCIPKPANIISQLPSRKFGFMRLWNLSFRMWKYNSYRTSHSFASLSCARMLHFLLSFDPRTMFNLSTHCSPHYNNNNITIYKAHNVRKKLNLTFHPWVTLFYLLLYRTLQTAKSTKVTSQSKYDLWNIF